MNRKVPRDDTPVRSALVIGWPIEHSRSPLIHSYWLDLYKITGSYEKMAVRPEMFDSFIRTMVASHETSTLMRGNNAKFVVGANITVPYKERAFQLADVPDDTASAVQAANTLWIAEGKLHAANTDVYGFTANLDESAPDWDRTDRPAAVLGAGGAARGIIYGLIEKGFTEIRLFNRTRARSELLAENFGSQVHVLDWDQRSSDIRGCSLLVNTTSLGMEGQPGLDIDLSQLSEFAVVTDLVYVPLKTPLLEQAERHRLRTVDGLGMLLHQAVPGFEVWFGHRPAVTTELRNLIISDLDN